MTSTALLAEVKKEKKAASASEREAERAAKAAIQAIEDEKKRKRVSPVIYAAQKYFQLGILSYIPGC